MKMGSDAHVWFDPLRASDGEAGAAGAGTGDATVASAGGGGSAGNDSGATNAGAGETPIEGGVLGNAAVEPVAEGAAQGEAAKEGGEGKGEAKPADPADQVPEKYELKQEDLPEGFAVDQALLDEFTPALKEAGVKQKDLPKLAGIMAQHERKRVEQFVATVKKWESEGRQDAEVGGAKYDESVAAARTAISEFGTPELRQYLFNSGMGNHPELLRFCARVGTALKQGQGVRGRPSTEALPLEKKMYGDGMRTGA